MRLLSLLLVLGCVESSIGVGDDAGPGEDAGTDAAIDASRDARLDGSGCPPMEYRPTCLEWDATIGACDEVPFDTFRESGCEVYRCPAGSNDGFCDEPECIEDLDCILDFEGCCPECDEDPSFAAVSEAGAEGRALLCEEAPECDPSCDFDPYLPFAEVVPYCNAGACDLRDIVYECDAAVPDSCVLTFIPTGNGECGELAAVANDGAAESLASRRSEGCVLPAGAEAYCLAGICDVGFREE